MNKSVTVLVCITMLLLGVRPAPAAANRKIRIGVGVEGPVSPQTEVDIENLVGALPNVKAVPIVPPGGLDACVKRFVAGDADDRLDGVFIVSLPTDSFKTERNEKEAKFTGAYEIWTVNLSTLEEDRHRFTFHEHEEVMSPTTAVLSIPVQLFAERATGKRLLSASEYQAYEAVQARVETKLIVATRIYLSTASIRDTGPLTPIETARELLERGDSETAMAVFRKIGMNNPEVERMIAQAKEQLKRADATALLGKTLGAMAGGDTHQANAMLAEYDKNSAAQPAQAKSLRTALAVPQDRHADSAYDSVLRADVPTLDRAGFVAMLKQMFAGETGAQPNDVIVGQKDITIEDKHAVEGLKTQLDIYASALGRGAWLMSLKCGCDAGATLVAEPAGGALLKAYYAPTFKRPQVGLP